ncbi:MAG: CorA family divalent cation transporter, partial [Thermoplasmata archaeon]
MNPEDFFDCLDPEERPRFELEEGYFLLMLRIPSTQHDTQSRAYPTSQVGFFVTPKTLLTVHSDAVDMVSYSHQRRRKRLIRNSSDLYVALLGSVVKRFDRIAREIQDKLTEFRRTILRS